MSHLSRAEGWLSKVGLKEDSDPLVVVLLSACRELDDLDAVDADEISMKDRAAIARAARSTIGVARRGLDQFVQRQVDELEGQRVRISYGTAAMRSLGWLDLNMLSADARDLVIEDLRANGVDPGDWEAEPQRL